MKENKRVYSMGISIYPERSNPQDIGPYLKLCKEAGFSSVFTNMLSINKKNLDKLDSMKEAYKKITNYEYDLIVDVAPRLYKDLNLKPDSKEGIEFLKKMGVTGVRFDEDYGGKVEANISRAFNLEINASTLNTNTAEVILSNGGEKSKIIACHNFYPQKYTGLSENFFRKTSMQFKGLGIKVAAFVTLDPKRKTIGAWEINEGMPTLEFLRYEDISYQIRWLFATGLVDSIRVSSQYVLEKDISEIKKISMGDINVKVMVDREATANEREVLNTKYCYLRGELTDDFLARCSITRIIYKDLSIPKRELKQKYFSPGDVVILNNEYKRYKGEINFIKSTNVINDGTRNLVGHISEREMRLFDNRNIKDGRLVKIMI